MAHSTSSTVNYKLPHHLLRLFNKKIDSNMVEKLTLKNRICDRKPERGDKDIIFKASLCQGICMIEHLEHVKHDLSYKGMGKSTQTDRSVTCGRDIFPNCKPGRKLIQCVKAFKQI